MFEIWLRLRGNGANPYPLHWSGQPIAYPALKMGWIELQDMFKMPPMLSISSDFKENWMRFPLGFTYPMQLLNLGSATVAAWENAMLVSQSKTVSDKNCPPLPSKMGLGVYLS